MNKRKRAKCRRLNASLYILEITFGFDNLPCLALFEKPKDLYAEVARIRSELSKTGMTILPMSDTREDPPEGMVCVGNYTIEKIPVSPRRTSIAESLIRWNTFTDVSSPEPFDRISF